MITAETIEESSTKMWSLGKWHPLLGDLMEYIEEYIDLDTFEIVDSHYMQGVGTYAAMFHEDPKMFHKQYGPEYATAANRLVSWHLDGHPSMTREALAKSKHAAKNWWMILWSDSKPTEFAKSQNPDTIYVPEAKEIILFKNVSWYHRMPMMSVKAASKRWNARCYLAPK